jgi:ATP-binding cassette subfamily F protein uup
MSDSKTTDPLLGIQSVWKNFGAQPVLRGVSLTVHEGDRIGFIGRNGSGKSTLLKIMAGADEPNEGIVTRKQGLRIAILYQGCQLDLDQTVGEALERAHRATVDLFERYHLAVEAFGRATEGSPEHARLASEIGYLQHELEVADAWNLDRHIRQASEALDLPPADRVLRTLSGGELRRVDLAATILRRPDLLLLDEPTNHIDINSIEWIENFLAGYAGSCVLVTHDRYFLERVANRIVELEFGRLTAYRGNYEDYLAAKAVRLEQQAQAEASRQGTLRRELAWLRQGAKARTTKQKARIQRYEELEAQGPPEQHKELSFEIPASRRLGKRILEVRGVSRAYDGKALFRDVSLILTPGMRVGIVGPNGSGKTTLLRVLMGREAPDSGEVLLGENTDFLYVDQSHDEIDPDATILQHVSNGMDYIDVDARRIYVPGYLERFLFDRASIKMPIKNLSGGERNRIELARKLLRGGNVLVLDEPTNDLDLTTLRLLEETIEAFEGCALIVSHDRYFLNRLCTHMIVFEGGGRTVQLAGNYEDYLLYRQKRAEARPAETPAKEAKPRREKIEAKPRRLTWHERKELENIEETILAAEAEVKRLEATIAAPEFYAGDYRVVQETLGALEAAKAEVARLYERWAELEALA